LSFLIREFSLDRDAKKGDEGTTIWNDCHAAGLKLACSVACKLTHGSEYQLSRLYLNLLPQMFSISSEVIIDCETGTATIKPDGCAQISFDNCGSINPMFARILEIKEELGIPTDFTNTGSTNGGTGTGTNTNGGTGTGTNDGTDGPIGTDGTPDGTDEPTGTDGVHGNGILISLNLTLMIMFLF